jgi:hypothetical protein
MESKEFEDRFGKMEQKVNLMAEFIDSLKASVEEKKAEPAKKKDLLGTILDYQL